MTEVFDKLLNLSVEIINKSGKHSWECQKAADPKIQKFIDHGFWIERFETDQFGDMVVVTEVRGMSEIPLSGFDGLTFVQHERSRTVLKFKI